MEDNPRDCTQVSIAKTLCDQEPILHILRSSDYSLLSCRVPSTMSVPRIRTMDSSGLLECQMQQSVSLYVDSYDEAES